MKKNTSTTKKTSSSTPSPSAPLPPQQAPLTAAGSSLPQSSIQKVNRATDYMDRLLTQLEDLQNQKKINTQEFIDFVKVVGNAVTMTKQVIAGANAESRAAGK